MDEADSAVVRRVCDGDQGAFRILVDRHSRGLFHLAYRMTANRSDAEDLVQETFLRAYRHLNRFDQRAEFRTWLHRARRELLTGHVAEAPAAQGGRPH